MLDFCYLVNPYFPNKKLIDEMQANFQTLLTQYPSGMHINSLIAAKNFGLKEPQIIVGNGAAELIKSLMEKLTGKIGVLHPSFEEYANRRKAEDLVPFVCQNPDYTYTADELMEFYDKTDIKNLLIVNPDNPSGNYIPKADVIRLIAWAKQRSIKLVIDESFVDFVDMEENTTLLEQSLLNSNPHLYVVKSISKSYGVPGLRLGILASGDAEAIATMKKDVAIWNINSFAEFYMQIYEKYKSAYAAGLTRFYQTRTKDYTSTELTTILLENNILIKDLSTKKGFEGKQYVRIAVRDEEDNQMLIFALKALLLK